MKLDGPATIEIYKGDEITGEFEDVHDVQVADGTLAIKLSTKMFLYAPGNWDHVVVLSTGDGP